MNDPLMTYKLCVFDFDGTLANTRGAVIRSMISTLDKEARSKNPITTEEIEAVVATGPTLPEAFRLLLAKGTAQSDIDEAVALYRSIYRGHANQWTELYPGVASFLKAARDHGIALAVVSNKGEPALRASLDALNIARYFTLILGEQADLKPKPAPDIFDHLILPSFPDVSRRDMLFVGDTPADLVFANVVGIDACWAVHGHGDARACRALNPLYVINGFDELAERLDL